MSNAQNQDNIKPTGKGPLMTKTFNGEGCDDLDDRVSSFCKELNITREKIVNYFYESRGLNFHRVHIAWVEDAV